MLAHYIKKLESRINKPSDPSPLTYMLTTSPENFPEGLGTIDYRKIGTNDAPKEKAIGFLWKDGTCLHVCAVMEDSDILNVAKEKNQRTWETGDVMELFFQPPEMINYYEIHLTPENNTLELSFPDRNDKIDIPFEELFYNSGIKTETGRFRFGSGISGWWGHMIVPFGGIGIENGILKGAGFSICRYNYNEKWGNRTEPEISSSAYYPEGGFHQPDYWHKII